MNLPGILAFILVGVAEIAIPLLLGFFVVRKFGLQWKIFLYGALSAIAYHSIVDSAAVYMVGSFGIWLTEAAIVLFAALGSGILWWSWNAIGERGDPGSI